MAFVAKEYCVLIVSTLIGIFISHNVDFQSDTILDENKWWGPGNPPEDEDKVVREFKINISNEFQQDLLDRIYSARPLILPLQNVQHEYGINTDFIEDFMDFWKIKYKWPKRQNYFNKFKQYTTNIQGLKIHYIREKPNGKIAKNLKIIPILLLHGWPTSIREFYDVVPRLIKPRRDKDFVFEVIVPSLPGFGFSEGASKPGLGATQMAILLNNFMKQIGFDEYYVQGGDWGGIIGGIMSSRYPENVLGFHSSMCFTMDAIGNLKVIFGSLYPSLIVEEKFTDRMYPILTKYFGILEDVGFIHLQATKPDSVGVALSDSPVGLAAYILEKFIILSSENNTSIKDGNLRDMYTYETLLDNIMIYWWTNSITTSMRLYAETFNPSEISSGWLSRPVKVPTACSRFKNDVIFQPETILRSKYERLVLLKDHDTGGHFPALEIPEIFAEDVWNAVDEIEKIKDRQ